MPVNLAHEGLAEQEYQPMSDRFELTEEHLALLRRAWIGWCDDEFGAPEIDPKRPYGNSDVVGDIARILGFEGELTHEQENYCRELHKQTETALQIILTCQTFQAGVYIRVERYGNVWRRETKLSR